MPYEPPDAGGIVRLVGWLVLLLALPLAFIGSVMPANEYKSWGLDALDCDGPFGVLLFGGLALIVYGIGLAANARHWRQPFRLIVALLCLAICGAIVANLVRAEMESRRQAEACRAR